MSKRIREDQEDQEDESNVAGPSQPTAKRPRRIDSQSPSESPDRLHELASDGVTDQDLQLDEPPALDEQEIEERIRAQIDAARNAGAGRVGTAGMKGIIESVEMVQFMCHKHLVFKFGDRFNFIIGHNGSGKSAVLTAITVALGGKANLTGRGNGIKSFIREGQSVAEVTVTLKNSGDDAYKPALFGSKIHIKRRFTSTGASSYKIQSDKGVTISDKKAALDEICDHMAIQVDNPLNVLTQDAARKFLGTTNEKDKYTFFLRGTHLAQLSAEYDLISANIQSTNHTLMRKAEDLPELKEALDAAQREFDEGVRVGEMRAKQGRLRCELAWSFCAEKEKELQQRFKVVADSDSRIAKMQDKLTESNERVDGASREIADIEIKHDEAQAEVQEINKRRETTVQEALTKRREIKAAKTSESEMNATLEEYNSAIKYIDQQLTIEAAKLEHASQAQRDEFEFRINASKTKITALEAELASAAADRDRLRAEGSTADREETQARAQHDTLQRRVKDITEEIAASNTQVTDRLAAFGNNMSTVLAAIKQARWHGREPVGPLGMYVELQDMQQWGDIMRITIGHQMRAFGITDSRDFGQLKGILGKFKNGASPIIIADHDLFDYRGGEPPPEYLTPIRVLKITDEYVRRLLINSASIERTYLAKNRPEAEDLMDQRGHGVVLTSECFRVTRYQVDNGRKSEALARVHFKDPRAKCFLEENRTTQISKLREDLQQAQRDVDQASAHLQQGQQHQYQLRHALAACMDNGRKLNGQLSRERLALEQIETEAREDAPTSISALQDEKKENEDAKLELLRQFEDLQTTKLGLEKELAPLQNKIELLQKEGDEAERRRTNISKELEDLVVKHAEALHAQKHYATELDKEKTKREQLQKVADTVQIEFEDWVTKAQEIGDKVEAVRPTDVVQREHDALLKGLEQRDRTHPKSLNTLRRELEEKRNVFQTVKKEIQALDKLNTILAQSLTIRQLRWDEWRAHCAIRCKIFFQYNLANRGYYGVLTFDHEEQRLKIKVQTDDQIVASQGVEKDPTALSGGEKSFSTICLLLALWETLGCPIRCLDEFDVFMDEANRQISAKMLMATARSTDGKQYILITPLDLNPRIIEPWVTVHRMADPERSRP